MSKNIIDTIWEKHVVKCSEGAPDMVFIDLQLLHEVTSPQAFSFLREKNLRVFDPSRNVATVDHSIPTDKKRIQFADQQNKIQIDTLRKNCADFGIQLYDTDSGHQGIVHVMGPELGLTQPGMTICCGDSHTSTHGAFGALAFGVGTTQIFHILASSCLLLEKPKTMKVHFVGTPAKYFTAKDAILALIKQIGVQGGTGYALEYCGEFIQNCSMEERMTICNMSIECGARSGLISPDEITFEWIKNTGTVLESDWEKSLKEWKSIASDENAEYDTVVEVNIDGMKPIITWGTTPGQSVHIDESIPMEVEMKKDDRELAKKSLAYTGLSFGQSLNGLEVQNVFVGSCTNGRFSDIKTVAEVLEGKKVAQGVRMVIVPGSEQVEKQVIEEGLDTIFKDAGAELRRPGCSMCLAMNGDYVPSGERCISTSNRNFMSRQGEGAITHLASPLMAGIAGVTGLITDPEKYFSES